MAHADLPESHFPRLGRPVAFTVKVSADGRALSLGFLLLLCVPVRRVIL